MQLHTLIQFLPPYISGFEAWAILLLRLIWGSIMVSYGWHKVKNPLHWMEEEKLPKYPSFLQAVGAFTIFGGGIATIAGFLTPIAALGLAGAMAVALLIHLTALHSSFTKHPASLPGPTYDIALVYFAIAVVFIFIGPGSFSVDYLLFGS